MTATAPIAGPDQDDLALLVAFDESDVQQRAAMRPRHDRQNLLLRLARSCPLLAAATSDLVAWLDSLDLSPASRPHYIVHLGHFYAWAVAEHLITLDPTTPLRPRAEDRRYFDLGDFPELLRGFWIAQIRRNLSAKTIDERRRLLSRLQRWMGERRCWRPPQTTSSAFLIRGTSGRRPGTAACPTSTPFIVGRYAKG